MLTIRKHKKAGNRKNIFQRENIFSEKKQNLKMGINLHISFLN